MEHLHPHLPLGVKLGTICIVQIQATKLAPDHADNMARTRQHDLRRSCRPGIHLPCLADLDHEVRIADLSAA